MVALLLQPTLHSCRQVAAHTRAQRPITATRPATPCCLSRQQQQPFLQRSTAQRWRCSAKSSKPQPPPPTAQEVASAFDDDEDDSSNGASIPYAEVVEDEDMEEFTPSQLREQLTALQGRCISAEEKLASAEEASTAAQNRYLRLNADWENYRKRMSTDSQRSRQGARSDVIKSMLPIVDSFEMARGQLQPTNQGEQKIDSAYQGVYKQMVELMRSLGVESAPGEGAPFDPNVHEAIMREEDDSVEDGTVLQVLRRGFMADGQLLRAAMVKVSFSNISSPSTAANAPSEADVEDAFAD